jgi:hypothetical protein
VARIDDCDTPVEGALAIRDAALGVVFWRIGLLIKGLTVAVGVLDLLVDLNGAIVDDVGFSEATGDTAATVDSAVLMIGFVELGTVKGLEVNDDEGELEDRLVDVVAKVLDAEDVRLGGDTSVVVLGLLEDSVDIVAVL